MVKKVDSYGWDTEFERIVAVMSATSPRFYGRIGSSIDIRGLRTDEVKLVFKAVAAIAKQIGKGPTHEATVIQRIRRWVYQGKEAQEDLDDVIDMFLDAPELPTEEEIVAEVAPVLKRRLQAEAVRRAMDEYAKNGDFAPVVRIINQTEALGHQDSSLGMRLGPGALKEIKRLRQLDRLPNNIPELDAALGGGLPRGCINIWLGAENSGKSMALSHVVANTISLGYCAVAATLELSEAAWQARVIANLLEYPINEIMEGDQKGLAKRLRKKKIGPLWVKDFPAKITTMPDIWQWVLEVEEEEGVPVDLVAIDYINKLKSHNKSDRSHYEGQGTAIETFRLLIQETGKWGHTAGQAQRRNARDRKRRIEGQDVAESMHLVRVPDMGISLNPDDETGEVTYFVARNRYGPKGITVGPFPHDFACGRMTYGP